MLIYDLAYCKSLCKQSILNHMNEPKELLDKVMSSLQSALPENLTDDIKSNVSAVVAKTVKELDLVSREELDIQMQVLAKTRQQLNLLEEKITKLEKRI